MATSPHLLSCAPIPFKVIEEKEGHPSPRRLEDYDDFMSTLPVKRGWVPSRKYQGFWYPEGFLPGAMAIQQHFKARPDDLFLLSFPKSGTTWLKALAFATMTRKKYPLARHPLLSLNPHDCVAYMDELFATGQASKVEALPSPRILATHMPYSWLPDSVAGSGCRIIYIGRDPKDALVSYWHFVQKATSPELKQIPFTEVFETFCEGKFPFGPIWDHLLECWRESLKRPEKVLFLKYEELLEEPVANVKRLAEFVGCPFSEEEEKGGMVDEIVRLCSIENMKSLEVNNKDANHGPIYPVTKSAFFRKGTKGDWRNHMSPEMARRLDGIVEEKVQGSGLTGWSFQD